MKYSYQFLLSLSASLSLAASSTFVAAASDEVPAIDESSVEVLKKVESETGALLESLSKQQAQLRYGLEKMKAKLTDRNVTKAQKMNIRLFQASFKKSDSSIDSLKSRLQTSSVVAPRLKNYAQWLIRESEKGQREFSLYMARADKRSHSVKKFVPVS